MGKNKDKMVKPAADKTPKGMKVDKAVKKLRKLEGKLWTREYLLKIAEFDGATIAPPTAPQRAPMPWAPLPANITNS